MQICKFCVEKARAAIFPSPLHPEEVSVFIFNTERLVQILIQFLGGKLYNHPI